MAFFDFCISFEINGKKISMFPASAGMNRLGGGEGAGHRYVPRERGDEPVMVLMGAKRERCSPRARG